MTDDKLTHAKTDLTYVLDHRTTARKRLEDQRLGQPGSGFSGGGGRGGGSPVETALGIAGPGDGNTRSDQAARDLAAADQLEKQLYRTVHLLRLIYEKQIPKAPTDKQRRDVERANSEPMEECSIMRELTNTFEPALCRSDCGGILPAEALVGRWAYDFMRSKGRRPTKREATAHANGRRVMVKA